MPGALFQVPARAAAFNASLEGLTRLNEHILQGAAMPPLYSAGVVYRKEPREVWRHAADVYAEGWGDCEDLAAWRAAELRTTGQDPRAAVVTYKSGPKRYHAVVARGSGAIEDPSRVLGMRAPTAAPATVRDLPLEGTIMTDVPIYRMEGLCAAVLGEEGDEPEDMEDEPAAAVVNDPIPPEEGMQDEVTTDVRPTTARPGFRAVARVPLTKPGRALVTASSRAATPDAATAKALNLASRALDSPYAAALLPPGAKLALNLLRSPQGRAIARGAFKFGKRLWRFGKGRKR